MIVRIMGEGQLELPDSALDDLNAFDRVAELAGDVLAPSDVVLPPVGATVADVRALFDGDGLIPG